MRRRRSDPYYGMVMNGPQVGREPDELAWTYLDLSGTPDADPNSQITAATFSPVTKRNTITVAANAAGGDIADPAVSAALWSFPLVDSRGRSFTPDKGVAFVEYVILVKSDRTANNKVAIKVGTRGETTALTGAFVAGGVQLTSATGLVVTSMKQGNSVNPNAALANAVGTYYAPPITCGRLLGPITVAIDSGGQWIAGVGQGFSSAAGMDEPQQTWISVGSTANNASAATVEVIIAARLRGVDSNVIADLGS